jgi:hypothetical protein
VTAESSTQLQLFLCDYVSNHEALKVLLLLARHEDRSMTEAEIASATCLSSARVRMALGSLLSNGVLLEATRRAGFAVFGYAPRDVQIRERVARLERAYQEDSLTIMRYMSANALARLRCAAGERSSLRGQNGEE